MQIINPYNARRDEILNFIVYNSSIENMMQITRTNYPRVHLGDIVRGEYGDLMYGGEVHELDDCKTSFSYNVEDFANIFRTTGIDVERLTLEKVVSTTISMLQKSLIAYIDSNSSEEHVLLDGKLLNHANFLKNIRYSFKTGELQLKRALSFLALLVKTRKEIYDYVRDDKIFLITSPEIANFIGQEIGVKRLMLKQYGDNLMHLFGELNPNGLSCLEYRNSMLGLEPTIFVNPNIEKNTMYICSTNMNNEGTNMFFYVDDSSFVSYDGMSTEMRPSKTIVVNIKHKFIPVKHKDIYKKIILEI